MAVVATHILAFVLIAAWQKRLVERPIHAVYVDPILAVELLHPRRGLFSVAVCPAWIFVDRFVLVPFDRQIEP